MRAMEFMVGAAAVLLLLVILVLAALPLALLNRRQPGLCCSMPWYTP